MEDEIVLCSSATDAGISCWDLRSGTEHLRYRSCSSPQHGLVSVGGRFLASSQLPPSSRSSASSGRSNASVSSSGRSSASSGSILYWSWNKPQVEVKSFPAERINPVAANSEGTYIVGGGVSGDIYLWEVETGRLLTKWHAHYRAVTCLIFSDDQSLLISGAEDGSVRVWSLLMIFDDERREESGHLYEYSFSEHTLPVTDIVTGYGGGNAIIVSASQDLTCKVWTLSTGKLLRNIVFPAIIEAIALDPGERVFYAGGRDGKIYIAELHAQGRSNTTYGLHIIGTLSDHSKAITCLSFALDGLQLVSGSEDGMVRVWNTETHNIIRIFKHGKEPVNNILVIRQPLSPQASSAKRKIHGSPLPPLEKYTSLDENSEINAYKFPRTDQERSPDNAYSTIETMEKQIKELEQHDSSAASEVEMERLKHENKRSMQMIEQLKKQNENLYQYIGNEVLKGEANVTSGDSDKDNQ